MRPVRLVMAGFGPYIKPTEIDFDKLGSGVYLICGDTGAGKTTIFDAMTYALYGSTSGSNRSPESMRSKYAANDEKTYVEFTFTIGAKTYTVIRNPSYRRASKRGGGETDEKASATLILPDGTQKGGISQVNEIITNDIMKISRDEFIQIAMIAQGEFLKLLNAGTEERRKIFSILFKTQNFEKLSLELASLTSQAKGKVKELETVRDHLLRSLSFEDESLQADMAADGKNDDEKTDSIIAQMIETDKKALTSLEEKSGELKKRQDALSARLEDAKKCAELVKARSALLQDKDKCEKALGICQQKKAGAAELLKKAESFRERAAKTEADFASYKELERLRDEHAKAQLDVKRTEELLKKNDEMLDNNKQRSQALTAQAQELEGAQERLNKYMIEREKLSHEKELVDNIRRGYFDLFSAQEKLSQLKKSTQGMSSRAESMEKQAAQLDDISKQLKAAEKELSDNKLEVNNAVHEIDDILKRRREVGSLSTQVQELEKAEELYDKAKLSYKGKAELYTKAQREYESAYTSYLDSIAGVLASEINEGEPCPVCGSVHHPNKAVLHEGAPTKEQVDRLQKSVQGANEQMQRAGTAANELGGKVNTLRQTVGEYAGRLFGSDDGIIGDTIKQELYGLDEKYAAAMHCKEELDRKAQELENSRQQLTAKQDKLTKASQQLSELKKELDDKTQEIKKQEGSSEQQRKIVSKQLEEMFGIGEIGGADKLIAARAGELDERISENEKSIALAGRQKEQAEKTAVMLGELKKEAERLSEESGKQRVLAAAGKEKLTQLSGQAEKLSGRLEFESLEKARRYSENARRQAADIIKDTENTDRELSECEKELAKVSGSIQSLDSQIKAFDGLTPEKDRQELDELQSEQKKVSGERDRVKERMNINSRTLISLRENWEDCKKAQEDYAQYKELSETAAGNISGAEKLSLEAYVQAEYFDNILARANERLYHMSDGKYTLRRSKAETRQGKTGLDLDVTDHRNGSQRSVKTLSGGESFMASLSLALGLSEEIQENAGGIRLDSMFIDEGFGTLDESSLELAVEVLEGLSRGERSVGVISHVADLRQRIAHQIRVTKQPSGGSSAVAE